MHRLQNIIENSGNRFSGLQIAPANFSKNRHREVVFEQKIAPYRKYTIYKGQKLGIPFLAQLQISSELISELRKYFWSGFFKTYTKLSKVLF